jgi:hypothetical protein
MEGVSTAAEIDIDPATLPVGTTLRRWYHGVLYVVEIVFPPAKGSQLSRRARRLGWWRYRYNGQRYKTLTAIAYEITGDRYMSGNRFFGLRKRRRGHRCLRK